MAFLIMSFLTVSATFCIIFNFVTFQSPVALLSFDFMACYDTLLLSLYLKITQEISCKNQR